MELIYTMRRKPLKYEPPHLESSNGGPTLCTISTCNIIAFTSLTELDDCTGDSWGSHVYVCDLNTPWDSHLVTSTVHQVSALEWDMEGKYLLVATSAGEVLIYGSREYLLNDWMCLYTASFPGEHIIKATFFHNGRRLVMAGGADKKEQVLCSDKFTHQRPTPTVRGLGGVACEGACVVTATGLLGACVFPPEPPASPPLVLAVAGESLGSTRAFRAHADICYKNGNLLIAVSGEGGPRCVRSYLAHVRRAAPASAAPLLTAQPLPSFFLPDHLAAPAWVRWCLREDTDSLLVGGAAVDVWKLTERALPVHSLLAKGSVVGNTTPGGGVKTTTDCFNTVVWQHQSQFRCEGRVSALASSKLPLHAPPYAAVATHNTIHLLWRDQLTNVCSTTLSPSGSPEQSAVVPAGGGATPPKKPKYGAIPSGMDTAVTSCLDISWMGGVLVAVDSYSQLHVYKLLQPATDIPTPMSIQHASTLLEYSLVTGYDCLDILMTLKPTAVDAVYERITESFQRQPATFQQYYYMNWLSLRAALSRLVPSGQARASDLTCLQTLHAISAAFKALLRPSELTSLDKGPAENLQAVLEDSNPPNDIDKVLMVLEAKEFAAEPSALQSLRRLIQRACDTALAALAALPARHAARALSPHPHQFELCSEPTALTLMRELLVVSRVWGLLRAHALPSFSRASDSVDVLATLYRLLTRLQANDNTLQECAALPKQVTIPRVWESLPRCCVVAPHGRPFPLYLEYGVEPEALRYEPEVPALEGSSGTDGTLDSIRYIHLGARPARARRCGRCGARAHAAANCARTHAQRAFDARYLPTCRCGGRWTMCVNT